MPNMTMILYFCFYILFLDLHLVMCNLFIIVEFTKYLWSAHCALDIVLGLKHIKSGKVRCPLIKSLVGETHINRWFLCLVERQKGHYRSAKKRCLVQHVLIQANLPAHGVWLTLEGYKRIIHEKREADKVRRGGKVFQEAAIAVAKP